MDSNDLRSSIESAIDSGGSNGGSAGVVSPDVGVSDATAAPAETQASVSPPEGDAGDVSVSQVVAADTRARDASGKFAKASQTNTAPTEAALKAKVPTPGTQSSTGLISPSAGSESSTKDPIAELKVPQSWKAAIREKFNQLPPELKANPAMLSFVEESVRVNQEVQKTMAEQAPARQFQQQMNQVLAPVEHLMRQRGVNPVQAIASYVQADRVLATGTQGEKAQMLASLVQSYGVDIKALDEALSSSGQPQTGQQSQTYDPNAIARMVEETVNQRLGGLRQQQQYAMATQETAKFSDGKEFWGDVKEDVADELESAARRGVTLSLDDAYNRAIWKNPELRAIVQQREQAKHVATAQAATQRNQAAGSSIRNQPATSVNGAASGGVRDDLMAAIAARSR